jgi:CPA1 family monovalent cation:H+ antiporter
VPPQITLTKELLFVVLLPPLIFEAGFYLRWDDLRRDLTVILVLATLGVFLAAAVTSAGMHFLGGWSWVAAVVFGVFAALRLSVTDRERESGARRHLISAWIQVLQRLPRRRSELLWKWRFVML